MNIKDYTHDQLVDLSQKIRDRIIEVVSKNGGHLSSTIGATEIIVAMHYIFDKSDPLIYDVSHQAYAHKLLSDRWDEFDTLRQFEGISGFTKPKESEFDYFVAGHSSTSISLAVGAAKAIKLKGENRVPVALIGDGSMSAGMVYEALNELGDRKYPVVIILNDNEMSIAAPIGAISNYLSQMSTSNFYQRLKATISSHLKDDSGLKYFAKKLDESLRIITPGILFEEMGIEYIGPIDGHNFYDLLETFQKARNLGKPVIIHVQTTKGKGYEIAEGKLEKWHGVSPFDIKTGKSHKKPSLAKSATEIFALALEEFANENEKVVGITAAMPSGTGLNKLIEKYPDRFFDVAIAEQHAVTSAAVMAKEGFIPFVAIYSTFLQRGFDQIIHDVAIMDLPVIFAIDRAGIVGEDGETHNGAFDISFLRLIPNLVLFAPRDEYSLKKSIKFAATINHPVAFRYPRGSYSKVVPLIKSEFKLGISELLKESSSNILFIGYGSGVSKAYSTYEALGFEVSILDLRFVKPLDTKMLDTLIKSHKYWFVFSDSAKIGGVASAILEYLSSIEHNVKMSTFEYDDSFIPHGNTSIVEESLEIDINSIVKKINNTIKES